MKKKTIIILSIILIILILLIFIFFDMTRIAERVDTVAKEEALRINDGALNTLVFAYSTKKEDNKLILTLYSESDVPKVVTTYTMKDGKVESITGKRHYAIKMQALVDYIQDGSNYHYTDSKLNGNIIMGTDKTTSLIGKTEEEVIQSFSIYENSGVPKVK